MPFVSAAACSPVKTLTIIRNGTSTHFHRLPSIDPCLSLKMTRLWAQLVMEASSSLARTRPGLKRMLVACVNDCLLRSRERRGSPRGETKSVITPSSYPNDYPL